MNIAKIMQNLANNIFFGKEVHMIPLNDFLTANIVNVTRFLSEINVSPFSTTCQHAKIVWHRNTWRRKMIRMNGLTRLGTRQMWSCCTGSSTSMQTRLARNC